MPAAGTTAKKGQSQPSLKTLTTKLKDIQASFDDIWRFVQQFQEDTTASGIQIRLDQVDELWEKFREALVEIRSHDEYAGDDESYDKERLQFSDRYYHAESFLMDKAKERQEPSEMEQSIRFCDTTMQSSLDHVRLPQITLQSFNGDIEDWLSFRDLFTSLIHWKTDLPEVEKFHYLKGCLQGEPRCMIDPLKITKANYPIAWDMLLKRYNNSKLLKKRQVQSLFKLPALSKESSTEMHTLVDGFERIVQTLDQVVQPGDYKDLLLVNLLTARLDPVTRRGWEEFSSTKDQDLLEDLIEFLHRRIRVLESLPLKPLDTRGVHQQFLPPKPRLSTVSNSYNAVQTSGKRCVACNANHLLYQCEVFHNMSVQEREALLRTHSLCLNCFWSGHRAKQCQSRYSCRSCNGRHHTLVCYRTDENKSGENTIRSRENGSSSDEQPQASTSTSTYVANMAATEVVSGQAHKGTSSVLLATAIVIVEDDEGNPHTARALLDSGSESNFISEQLCQRMKITRELVNISVRGIGQSTNKVKHTIRAKIRSRVTTFSRDMDLLVLPNVMVNLPTTTLNVNGWSLPKDIQLADPAFGVSSGVDIVLGVEYFFDFFLTGKKITLGERLPTLNESVCMDGWFVVDFLPVQIRLPATFLQDIENHTIQQFGVQRGNVICKTEMTFNPDAYFNHY